MANTIIDYMEYATDAAAQAAYVTDDDTALQSYSESSIKTQGDYSLKGVAAGLVDQQQPNNFGGTVFELGNNNGYQIRDAQGFQLSDTRIITAVEVGRIGGTAGSPTGNWTLRIETDNASKPSGTLANANASIVVAPPNEYAVVKGTFATPFSLSGLTLYWLVINCDSQTTDNHWVLGYDDNAYAYGKGFQSADGNWSEAGGVGAGHDLYFKIYVQSSLNKTLTRTIT